MKKILLLFSLVFSYCLLNAQQLAFPGADGYGKYATGGRGGIVYHVSNLNDSGVGSFRDAVSQPKRTVVFDVSGVIKIQSKVTVASYITIAGQTAPGDGIVVYGNGVSLAGANDVIVRYMRFRGSVEMGKGVCTLAADNAHDIIFDHVSVEWGRWDNLHIKESDKITLQYCIIGEGINPQMFGALLENPTHLTIHHCLWVDNQSRNPKAKASIEIINNVIYNWGSNGLVGGHSAANHFQDIINNYFIAGPNSTNTFIGMFTATDHVYQKGNMVDLNKNGKLDGRMATEEDFAKTTATLIPDVQYSSLSTSEIEQPAEAYKNVLAQAGASLHRDAIDSRLIDYVKSLGKEGQVIRSEAEVGGQKAIKAAKAPKDTDGDGIPDSWEKKHQLNPGDAKDGSGMTATGYSRLEEYLNELTIR
ncbi:MAG: pectate lyase [Paludibacter sp.]